MRPILFFLIATAVTLIFLATTRLDRDHWPEPELELKSEPAPKLTLEQKVGQLFIIGFKGEVLTEELKKEIKELHPGGILLLKKNIKDEAQLKKLISDLQEVALSDTGIPLLIAVDQEGGEVSRAAFLAEKTEQSKIDNSEQAHQIGLRRGQELKELGINLNLAPLLDQTQPGDFIDNRSFKKEPELTGELAKNMILGQKEAGILTAIKHFPGYIGISFNPEENLAYISKIPEISQFKEAIKASPELIMTANVIYEQIDKDLPFTFSKKGIQFLKNELTGSFLIVSDDLDQYSLLNQYSLKDIVSLPIEAGVDILIFSGWRLPSAKGVQALLTAVRAGWISEQRIDQSVLKIIKLKQEMKQLGEF